MDVEEKKWWFLLQNLYQYEEFYEDSDCNVSFRWTKPYSLYLGLESLVIET